MARQPISMSVDGFDAVSDVLKKVAPREARNILRNTVHAVAGEIRNEMRQRVKETVEDTGTLRKAIVSRRERPRGNIVASNVTITHGKRHRNNAYYWHMVNYGTVNTGGEGARFIETTVEAMRPQIPGIFTREFSVKYEQLLQRKLRAAARKK